MTTLFSLGKLYPSDFLSSGEEPRCEPIELKMMLDDYGRAYLEETAPPNVMWGEKYWYRSSISSTMKSQLKDVVDSVLSVYELKPRNLWIDAAGNDGYMLSQVPSNLIRVNIDPANDSFKQEAEKHCDLVIQDYFSAEAFKKSKYGGLKANLISCVSMFYDLSDPDKFLDDVYKILDDDGLFVLQLSYTPLMIEQLEFSNICHEHKYYYSLSNLRILLEYHGYRLMDVSLNNTNAGSFRLFCMKKTGDETKFGSQTHRDVCKFRINSLLQYEYLAAYNTKERWMDFFVKINKLKEQTLNFIEEEKLKGKTIYGYGASTKFNTVLQYFGLNTETITAIADRSEAKHGLRTIGSNIPIISEQEMREKKPDYLLVGPAHFISEFKERERELLKSGTKFICIMPKFEIIGL